MASKYQIRYALHKAIEARDEKLVQDLVKIGCNGRDWEGRTPLHLVATRPFAQKLGYSKSRCEKFVPMDEEEVQSRVRIANLLINAGANINSKSHSVTALTCCSVVLKTPLEEAALCQNEAIVELLLQYGAEINAKTQGKTSCCTPLHSALTYYQGNTGLVNMLIDYGNDVNAVNHRGNAPLHLAVEHPEYCSAELIELFLKHGADINAKSRQTGDTALHLVVNRFRTNAYPTITLPTFHIGNDFINYESLDVPDMKLVKVLLEHGSDVNAVNRHGDTPLHLAVKHPTQFSEVLIRLFLKNGANVNLKERHTGNTVLRCAVTNFKGNVNILEILLEHADVNAVNTVGETPLHLAAKSTARCSVDMIELFLKCGADVNFKARYSGNTALHFAVNNFQGKVCIVKILLEHGDVNAVNRAGETPLHLAARNPKCSMELIKLLLQHGADVDKKRKSTHDSAFQLYINAHLPSSVDPTLLKLLLLGNDREDHNRMSPLHDACLFHRVDSVHELLRAGADPVAKDSFGHVPMFYALVARLPTKMYHKFLTVRLLMDYCIDLDQKYVFLTIGHDKFGWKKGGDNSDKFISIFYNYAIQRMELSNGLDGRILKKFVLLACQRTSQDYDFWFMMDQWYKEYRSRLVTESQYVIELRLMRDTMVGKSEISFLDLLEGISEQKVLTAYGRNYEQLAKDFEAGKSKFLLYQGVLEASFYKSYNECTKLIKNGAEALSVALGFGYSVEVCFRKYLSYYSKEELERLNE
ncbi:hypothetical protein TSAR_015849 [Trichomalopsis sarcophagae]|uniref:Uncharacterized protein n=1 Tax=Trichomalopsis sarcophagae TaxID=543379 RepID=A0A232FBG7_9HYME|nr:hypothetical protein TSAR_015849 [Trichomalopsis sarcophagae]